MNSLQWLLVSYAVIFAINVVPAFMPATWMVVAFFLIAYRLPFWPLCVGSAVAATSGRSALAYISRQLGGRLLSARQRQNVQAVGNWLNTKSGRSEVMAVLLYSLGPIPSNQMFIGAGLANVRLAPVVLGFFAGRLVSYPLFAASARGVGDHLGTIFIREWNSPKYIVLEFLSIAGVIAFAHIDWPRVLHLPVPSARGSGSTPSADAPTTGPATDRHVPSNRGAM